MQSDRACIVWAHCHGVTRRSSLFVLRGRSMERMAFMCRQAIATLTDTLYIYLFNKFPALMRPDGSSSC